jgi:DNA-binding response OmpR family regulator
MSKLNPSPNLGWILIVDDEKDLTDLLVEPFQQSGYRTLVATNPADAISKINRQKFLAVLLDLKLDRGSGELVLAAIRKEMQFHNDRTPVILMSGFLSPDVIARVRTHVQSVVAKPFRPTDIVKLVNQLVSQAAGNKPSGSKPA